MERLYVAVKKQDKIIVSGECSINYPIEYNVITEALSEICREIDIAVPVILSKHINQLNVFMHTHFSQNDFIEKINFTKLTVEIFLDQGQK